MAVNIHTDPKFEENLAWLSRKLNKTKTEVLKELVAEKCEQQRLKFQSSKGALRIPGRKITTRQILRELKKIKADHDLD